MRVFHDIVPDDGCLALLGAAKDLERIETPCHGWIYDLNGRLTAIPFWDGSREASLESVQVFETDLVEVACETFWKTIFINLAPEPEFRRLCWPLRRQFGEIDFKHSTAALDEKGQVICPESEIATNWKTYYENACLNVLHEN